MYGIIDIGSNSIRLMTNDCGRVNKEVVTTRLAEGMKCGVLQAAAIERSVDAISSLRERAGACTLYAYATEAIRSAVNKDEFLSSVKRAADVDIDVLSGEEEARCSYLGAINGLKAEGVMTAVVDIGGASTELIVGDGYEPIFAKSAPLGIVRLKDACGENDRAIDEYLEKTIVSAFKVSQRPERLLGIGGTVTSLAAMAMQLKIYDRDAVHGYTLTRERIRELKALIKATPVSARSGIAGLNPSRIETIYQGVRILETVMDIIGLNEAAASESDNLEGYAILKGIK